MADIDKISHLRETSSATVLQSPFAFTSDGDGDERMDKKEALSILFSAAEAYQEHLVDHSLLFLCADRNRHTYCFEVTFDINNFKHLTGCKTSLSPRHFYRLCLAKRLSVDDFEFAGDGTTEWKLKVLPRVISRNLSANMVGEYNDSMPILYTERVAGNISACISFVHADDHPDSRYVPNTVLMGDIRTLVHKADRILVTYRKKRDETAYGEIVYAAKKVDLSAVSLPENYSYLPLP